MCGVFSAPGERYKHNFVEIDRDTSDLLVFRIVDGRC